MDMKTYKSCLLITLLMIVVMPTFAQTVHIERLILMFQLNCR